jgi:DNA-directed RNA polymerase specialized sigma24 family protein
MASEASRPHPGLSREAFDLLLQTLHPVRERAGERYEAIRARLLRFFLTRGALWPEELADVTIDRVCRKLAAGEVIRSADAGLYFLGVASNVAREAWTAQRKRRDRDVGLEQAAAVEAEPPAGMPSDADAFACLERCLRKLAPETRDVLLQYYDSGTGRRIDHRRGLAGQLGIAPNALRIRLHRVRVRLEACIEDCVGKGATPAVSPPTAGEDGES